MPKKPKKVRGVGCLVAGSGSQGLVAVYG
jgi:hypothetical protein